MAQGGARAAWHERCGRLQQVQGLHGDEGMDSAVARLVAGWSSLCALADLPLGPERDTSRAWPTRGSLPAPHDLFYYDDGSVPPCADSYPACILDMHTKSLSWLPAPPPVVISCWPSAASSPPRRRARPRPHSPCPHPPHHHRQPPSPRSATAAQQGWCGRGRCSRTSPAPPMRQCSAHHQQGEAAQAGQEAGCQ